MKYSGVAQPEERKIYRLAFLCATLAAVAFILPRFVTNPEGGFASGASAILTLLILLTVTLVFSLYLLTITLRQSRNVSRSARVVGLAPSLIFGALLAWLLVFLAY